MVKNIKISYDLLLAGWHLQKCDIILDFVFASVVLAMNLNYFKKSHKIKLPLVFTKVLIKIKSLKLIVGNCDSSIYC